MFRLTSFLAVLVLCGVGLARADDFGTGANQFSIDFVTISGSTNPTVAQTTAGALDGFGIVNNDYRMGKYEITNDHWNKFKAELGVPVTGDPSFAYGHSGTGATNVPTNLVSWYEAAQFVNWLNTSTNHQAAYKFTGTQGDGEGDPDPYTPAVWESGDAAAGGTNLYRNKDAFYFLPDEDEWFKAAYWNGTNIQDYATKSGDTLHQGDGMSGTGWNYYDGVYAMAPPGPWDVGSGSEELNGTHDMMGNHWEWMESPYHDTNYGAGSSRGVRGGMWQFDSSLLPASRREGFGPSIENDYLGFRVASIPEPGSIT